MFVLSEFPLYYLHSIFDTIASFAEILTDESFWTLFFGERGLSLIKRYIANDAIFVGLFLSLGPTLLTLFQTYYSRISEFINQFFYVTVEISDDESIYHALDIYCKTHFLNIKSFNHVSGITKYDTVQDNNSNYEKSTSRLSLIPRRGCVQDIKYKGYKLWINRENYSPLDKNRGSGEAEELLEALSATHQRLIIRMRSRNIELLRSIIQEWLDEYYEKKTGQLVVHKFKADQWGGLGWYELCSKGPRSFDSVVLKKHQKEEVLEDLLAFRTQKQWYLKTGIPYRRGYLLHGPPGTGKTSFIQSLASKVNMNVALISLTTAMSDDDFVQALVDAPKNSIVVMEDIDHCTINDGDEGDSKSKSEKRVTATGLLNALDGVFSPEGSLVFLTANDTTKLTPALLRPGRVDVKVLFGYSDRFQTEAMFWRFFAEEDGTKDPKLTVILEKLLDMIPDDKVSTAELQNLFMSHAMILNSRRKVRSIAIIGKSEEDNDDDATTLSEKDDDLAKMKYFERLLDSIPAFLERVAEDREQAKLHAARKGHTLPPTSSKKSTDDNNSNSDQHDVEDEEEDTGEDW
ncbi:P-loop containing nucleoside triphosphate hydrolase protein [Phascolomyces articulosus]|uniref:P-loop containing nucleoside triphosphate hydrolase protein n=1 Tax=Phascolomyces articulosus TaxID=60185 RepID=A0AAD5K2T6_9FUNG|nr:P-loop containing nucleoside triphosphate hydrolase protein [Phascolomyces articulosus]